MKWWSVQGSKAGGRRLRQRGKTVLLEAEGRSPAHRTVNRRCRPQLRKTNGSWRVDETYLHIAADGAICILRSNGRAPRLILAGHMGCCCLQAFFQEAAQSTGRTRPIGDHVDGKPSYPAVIAELKKTGELGRRCRCRAVGYVSNIVAHDHRTIKRRVRASQGFRSLPAFDLINLEQQRL